MSDARTPRSLLIPDHLWQVFEQMAEEMGSDRDGLVNQALFDFARRSGYLAPGAVHGLHPVADALPEPVPADGKGAKRTPGKAKTLVLLADGREIDRIVKSRFVIGRGKHCDLVIPSGKVSREHAAISREGETWFIEDLGSSNGTWFGQRRITRRQIREGDEYFICAERLSCVFR
jgi:FHA domain